MAMNNNNVLSTKFNFYNKVTNDLIEGPVNVDFNDEGEIDVVIDANGAQYHKDSFVYTNLVLNVPGLGAALCGDLIVLKVKNKISEYTLGFGWHVNISNQKIYSWYLLPLDNHLDTPDVEFKKAKTLYYDDLINVIGITRQMPGILPTDIVQEV